jgi:hypothetical protein
MDFMKTKFNSNLVASANSTLNAPPTSYAYLIYIFLLLIVMIAIYYGTKFALKKLNEMNELKNYFNKTVVDKKKLDETKVGEKEEKEENIIGNYCYVGEDLTGRFCVKVPDAELCPSERAFRTRAECEMVKASPMPLTVQTERGTKAIPLSGLPTV